MPHDFSKSNATNASNTTGRPLMPTLASNRSVRSPLTPRLAVQNGGSTPTATPGSRRSIRSDLTSVKSPAVSKEDLATPVKAFINTNVTPRSSSRKSRADSTQSTPDVSEAGTPVTNPKFIAANGVRVEDAFTFDNLGVSSQATFSPDGLGGSNAPRRPQSMLGGGTTPTYPLARPPLAGRATSPARATSPMFFHASNARSQEKQEPFRPPLKKGPSFFYADGKQDEDVGREASLSPSTSLPSPPLSGIGAVPSRFFHADGSAERLSLSPPVASPPLPASISEIQLPSNMTNHMPNLRPASPTKESIHLSYRKGASQIMRPASILPPRPVTDGSTPQRRTSVGASKRISHAKGSSLSSIDSVSNVSSGKNASRRSSLNVSQQQQTADASTKQSRRVSGNPSLPPTSIQIPPLVIEGHPVVATPGSVVTPLSPTKGGMSQATSELAAQARRERKVMDLEISNSSLLAINRQLEREVRKQKVELRRYRRLTRAGRLSVAAAGITAVDEEDAEIRSDDEDQDGMGMLSDDEDEEDDDLSESDESALSPAALAEHDQKRIAKDEKRLRLDLSKHRQLLVDSQKMNQSLRRCLGWTEELISEGKKALSYRVRVSDVKLGGRVLRRDDDFDDGLEEVHLEDKDTPLTHIEDDDEEEHIEVEEEEAKDIGDVMSLMSPWMRSGPRSGIGTPIMPADALSDTQGLGIETSDGTGLLPGPS